MHGIGTALTTESHPWQCDFLKIVTRPTSSWCSRVRATATKISNLTIFNIRLAQHTDLVVDVILRHDFIGASRDGWINHGKLRNPDHPDQPYMILEGAAAQIRNNRNPYRRNLQVAFLPAYMSTSGCIHCEFLHLLFFLANKQADDYFQALGYQPHKQEFCHRRSVFFQQPMHNWHGMCSGCCATWRAHTARRHVAAPRDLPPLNMAFDEFSK